METWKLGAYHHALIYHAMSGAMTPEERAKFDMGDLPRGGDADIVNATPGLPPGIPPQILATMPGGGDPHNQFSGGSFKIIADTEDWDIRWD